MARSLPPYFAAQRARWPYQYSSEHGLCSPYPWTGTRADGEVRKISRRGNDQRRGAAV